MGGTREGASLSLLPLPPSPLSFTTPLPQPSIHCSSQLAYPVGSNKAESVYLSLSLSPLSLSLSLSPRRLHRNVLERRTTQRIGVETRLEAAASEATSYRK